MAYESPGREIDRPEERMPAGRAAAFGLLIGGLACQIAQIAASLYARAHLPADADMGERFAVGMEIWGIFGIALAISLAATIALTKTARAWLAARHPATLRLLGLAGAVIGAAGLPGPDLDALALYLGLFGGWLALHCLGAICAR